MPGRAVQLREAPSEEVANQELPTSTFAAQIIEHFTQNATNRGPADRAEIRELLEELRQTKEAGTGYTLNDAELEKNYHLICIVATAGFTPRQPKDVSEDKDELISQALDSIDIIDLTIAQGSDVLFLFAMSKVPHIPNGPTFLWLIPGLLNLFLTWNDARVQAKTQAVLRRITTCKPRHGGLRRKGPVISLFLKGCVDDIMLEIDASQSSQRRTSKHRMHIPSANTVSKASSIQGSLQQLHTTSRIDISTSLQAVLVLQQCLEPLLPDLTEINKPWLLKRSDHNLTWMLQSLKLSYRVLLNYPKPSNDRGEYEMSQRSAMDLLCRLLANSCKAEAAPTLKVQIAASLSEIISELLQSTTFPSHEIQLTMSRSILIFYKLSYEDVGVSSILMNFTHILDEAQKNSHQTSILLPDLECSLVLVRDLKPTLESSPDSKLSRISFESSELSTIFGRLLKRNLGLPDNFHDMKGVVYQETNGNVDGPQAWASDIDRMLSRDISTNEILTFTELQSRIL
ncbi:serine/threonine-protein kinase M1 [Agyrium rufum]|nr:serine/threonine-protein kinase M1 [Agyrium rufum]